MVARGAYILCLCFLAAVWVAGAAEPPPQRSGTTAEAPVDVRMEEVEIKGELERPGVFYIIPRRPVELDLGRQTKDYTAELALPLDPEAFARWVRLQEVGR